MRKLEWRTVLVHPRNPLNLGAAARAVANFGLREMVVVAPFEPTWQEARTAAPGADVVIEVAHSVRTLPEAIADATVVIGTTTGARRNLGRELIAIDELASWLGKRKVQGRVAVLFGSEKTGLSNEDMSYCHILVRIPTSADCPSMNLGQAVAVCAYELARSGLVRVTPPKLEIGNRKLEDGNRKRGTRNGKLVEPPKPQFPVSTIIGYCSPAANLQTLEHLFDRATELLDACGYLQPKSRAAALIKLRRFLLDLKLTTNDARILGGVLTQVAWKLQQR